MRVCGTQDFGHVLTSDRTWPCVRGDSANHGSTSRCGDDITKGDYHLQFLIGGVRSMLWNLPSLYGGILEAPLVPPMGRAS